MPDTASYRQVPVSRSRAHSLTLVNRGTEALFVDSVVAIGSFDLPADPLTSTALFLPAADSLTVAVHFSPAVTSNGGDGLFLIDADGDTASTVASDLSWNSDQSVTRYPSGRGPFVTHSAQSIVDSIRLIPADTTVVEGQ